MTRPLGQLTRIAREIAQGNFVAPIPTFSGPLEVSTLAVALQRSHATMRQALDQLAQTRDWFNNLIQSIVEGVIIFDNRGRILFLSQGAETLSGWQSQEAVGQSVNDLFRLAEAGNETFLDVVPASGQRRRIDVLARHNQPLTLAVTGARLAPLNGDRPQTALVLRDVTSPKRRRRVTCAPISWPILRTNFAPH
jgi:PAS domain S-box-containing protein